MTWGLWGLCTACLEQALCVPGACPGSVNIFRCIVLLPLHGPCTIGTTFRMKRSELKKSTTNDDYTDPNVRKCLCLARETLLWRHSRGVKVLVAAPGFATTPGQGLAVPALPGDGTSSFKWRR